MGEKSAPSSEGDLSMNRKKEKHDEGGEDEERACSSLALALALALAPKRWLLSGVRCR